MKKIIRSLGLVAFALPVLVNAMQIPDSKLGLIKTDSTGNVMWKKAYQIGSQTGTIPYFIDQTSESGYAILCKIDSIGDYLNWFLILDSLGDTLWTYQFIHEDTVEIFRTPGDGFVVSCLPEPFVHTHTLHFKDFDSRVFKIDSSGDTTWTGSFAGAEIYSGNRLVKMLDGGYIRLEETLRCGKFQFKLTKYDSLGLVLWNREYDKHHETQISWLEPTSDSGCIVGGYRGKELILMKLDSRGKVQWRRFFKENKSPSVTGDGFVRCVRQRKDGGYIFAALFKPRDYLVSTDSKGRVLWRKSYEGFLLRDLWLAPEQGYFVLGLSLDGVFLFKIDDEGKIEWKKSIDEKCFDEHTVYAITTSDGGCVIAGEIPKKYYKNLIWIWESRR